MKTNWGSMERLFCKTREKCLQAARETAKAVGQRAGLVLLATAAGILFPASAVAQTVLIRNQNPETTVNMTISSAATRPDHPGDSQGEPTTVTLDELVREALQKNPAIRSAARRVQAMRARVPQAKSLPDPVVSAGWMGRIVPFTVMEGDPSSFRSITAMQEFPFPGKLKLHGQMADRDAEAAQWDLENTRRQIVAEVKAAYYNYYYDQKALDITRKDKNLLEKLTKIAEVRYQVGKGIQQDVLRAQVELSRLLQQLTVLEQEEKTARVRLNTLLFRDPEAPLPHAASFVESRFTYTLDELYELARQNDPGLEREKRIIERNQYAVNLAQKEYDPDLRVGYMYQQRPFMPDMHGVTFGIEIPIFYKNKQREGVIEASENLTSARRSLDDRLTTVNFEVKQQYLAAKASEDLARLYSQAIVPQSSLALESSMASYEVGQVDFLSMLDNFMNVLNFEINYYRELSNFQIALARLEPLVGRELTK
jgi:outer membrane protein, heavy metal efflux system